MDTEVGQQTKEKVLIVDDAPANITQLNHLLGDEYQVFFATNGEDGLEIAGEQQPDLVLMDVSMPGMDGYEVCRHLKANASTEQILVIFVTAHTDAGEEGKGLQLGAVDYIHKPFSPQLVQLRVRTQLTLKRQRDQLEAQVREVTMMFQIADILIEHAISGGDSSVGAMIGRITSGLRLLTKISASAAILHDPEGGSVDLPELVTEIERGVKEVTETLDETVVAFQDMDRLSQQLQQISGSLHAASALINDPQRINQPEEWQQMYEEIRGTFAMMDAQVLYESILAGESRESALLKAGQMKKDSQDLFEAF